MFGAGAKPLTGGGQMGGASFWDRMMQRQQGGARPPALAGPRAMPMGGGAMGAAGGAQPPPVRPMGAQAGMLGGIMPPRAQAQPQGMMARPSPLGGMNTSALMSDEAAKKNAYLSGLNDRFAAIGGESIAPGLAPQGDEEEQRKKRMGLEMFQSGMGQLGGGRK